MPDSFPIICVPGDLLIRQSEGYLPALFMFPAAVSGSSWNGLDIASGREFGADNLDAPLANPTPRDGTPP
jgi:hypothetical protein